MAVRVTWFARDMYEGANVSIWGLDLKHVLCMHSTTTTTKPYHLYGMQSPSSQSKQEQRLQTGALLHKYKYAPFRHLLRISFAISVVYSCIGRVIPMETCCILQIIPWKDTNSLIWKRAKTWLRVEKFKKKYLYYRKQHKTFGQKVFFIFMCMHL